MKLKKRIIPMLAGLLAAVVAVTGAASAHTKDKYGPADFFEGTYKWLLSSTNFILVVEDSAQTDLLTKENVYDSALTWNHISNKVNVSVVYECPGIPTSTGQVTVTGADLDNNTMGKTIPYDENGKPLFTDEEFDLDWKYIHIEMNTNPFVFSEGSAFLNPTKMISNARKTFIHEVGHALKLKHPDQNYMHDGHYIEGYPSAIMNQGYIGSKSGAVTANITSHDESCLRAKWGA